MVPSDIQPQVLTPLFKTLSIGQCIPLQQIADVQTRAEARAEEGTAVPKGGPSVEQQLPILT